MNIQTSHPTLTNRPNTGSPGGKPLRQPLRDTGMGYGSSSSYGQPRPYATAGFTTRFRIG